MYTCNYTRDFIQWAGEVIENATQHATLAAVKVRRSPN